MSPTFLLSPGLLLQESLSPSHDGGFEWDCFSDQSIKNVCISGLPIPSHLHPLPSSVPPHPAFRTAERLQPFLCHLNMQLRGLYKEKTLPSLRETQSPLLERTLTMAFLSVPRPGLTLCCRGTKPPGSSFSSLSSSLLPRCHPLC